MFPTEARQDASRRKSRITRALSCVAECELTRALSCVAKFEAAKSRKATKVSRRSDNSTPDAKNDLQPYPRED